MPAWLKDAVFYEIYPQSFYDSNADGIGDLKGITEKLDYIRELGCNAIWLNPCYDSPFKDAGYDVRDYKKVAPRYGTNEDLKELIDAAHDKGMHILLDLVPGHTSEEHEWFLQSQKAERNEYSDRYIWNEDAFSGMAGYPYIVGESERAGAYLLNFYKCQPALNYGFLHPQAPWQKSIYDPACIGTREALKDIMRFWLDFGCDGFRVDMADSLVKCDDEKKTGTSRVWQDVRRMLDREYPQAAIVSEWSNPELSLNAGFHMDFMLDGFGRPYSYLARDYANHGVGPMTPGAFKDGKCVGWVVDHSYFHKDSGGSIRSFLDDYERMYAATRDKGYISLISCNHDTPRPSLSLDDGERRLFMAFILTMPGVPFIYYGDEIGMRYLPLPTKEGGYARTGSRTPMQWGNAKNLGFSEADEAGLYLPVDDTADAPTVASQMADSHSLYHAVKEILALRHEYEDLQADAPFEAIYAENADPLFVYGRGKMILAVNPSSRTLSLTLPEIDSVDLPGAPASIKMGQKETLYTIGSGSFKNGAIELGPQSFIILN